MAVKNRRSGEKLGNKIQRTRKSLGYSQEKLAELIGISRTHIGHIEQGRKNPSLEVLHKIAKTLKTPTFELLKFR